MSYVNYGSYGSCWRHEKYDVSPKPWMTRGFAKAGEIEESRPQPWQKHQRRAQVEDEEQRPQPWQVLRAKSEKKIGGRA